GGRAQGRDAQDLRRGTAGDRRPARVLRQLLGAGPRRVQGGGREGEEEYGRNTQAVIAPVHKTMVVDCSPERAFEVFTRELGTWWPLGSHSIGGEQMTGGVVEAHVSG